MPRKFGKYISNATTSPMVSNYPGEKKKFVSAGGCWERRKVLSPAVSHPPPTVQRSPPGAAIATQAQRHTSRFLEIKSPLNLPCSEYSRPPFRHLSGNADCWFGKAGQATRVPVAVRGGDCRSARGWRDSHSAGKGPPPLSATAGRHNFFFSPG